MKTRYFNTGFVSLQYKNTNQYWSKCSTIYEKITKSFLKIFFEFIIIFLFIFFGLGPARPVWLGWTQQSCPGHWPNPVTRLPKACMRELFTHAVHSAKVIKITFAQCYITTTDEMKKKKLPSAGRQSRWRWLDDSPGLTCGGSTGGAYGGCWLENGLDGGQPFFFFSSAFFFLLLCSPLFLFSSSVSHGAVAECSLMALKAALLVVADRRMAWTVVGFSSSSCLCFFPSLFSSVSVFFFCFSRCCCRVCCDGVAVGGDGGSSPFCAEAWAFFFFQVSPSLSVSFFSLPYIPPLLFFFSIGSFPSSPFFLLLL